MTKAAELAKMGEVLTNSQVGGRRNIIINGGMNVAQRSASETGLGATSGYHTVDRYRIAFSGTAGRLTMTQTADGPSGFANCIKLDCTTADTSIAAGELMWLEQRIEGQDLQQFKKGTSDAEQYSVSFYVKGNANATYALELDDPDNSRHIVKLFSVTTAWTRIIMTFPADTTGAFNDDNALSLSVKIWLHAGSTYTSGTLQSSAWAGLTAANRAVGITSFFDSTDRTFFLTGLQMEVGSQATPFEHRSFGEELALCQRYFEKSYDVGITPATVTQSSVVTIRQSGANAVPTIFYKQNKRASATMTYYSAATGASGKARNNDGSSDVTISSLNNGMSANSVVISGSDGTYLHFHYTSDSEL